MSEQNWKAGDVALVTFKAQPSGDHFGREGSRLTPGTFVAVASRPFPGEDGVIWYSSGGGAAHSNRRDCVVDARRLVVIDAEDETQIDRLRLLYNTATIDNTIGIVPLKAALRQFADPKPRIEEPTKTGSVVHDHDGEAWVRYARGEWSCLHSRPGKDVRTWAELVAQYGPIDTVEATA